MAEVFGLDFGTTNSLACFIADEEPIDFVTEERPHPSVVLYRGGDVIVGRQARQQLERTDGAVVGDAVISPKRALLAKTAIHVGGTTHAPREVISHVIRHVVDHARAEEPELPLGEAVITIPVRLDGAGRRELRRAAHDAGIAVRQFVHEPLAALYAWLRAQGPDALARYEGKLMLVFDWGGGTLDLTLCRMVDGILVQLHNRGDDRVGGDVFDQRLKQFVRRKHFQEHALPGDLQAREGADARLLTRCEDAKIGMSKRDDAVVFLADYAEVPDPASSIEVTLTRGDLEELNGDLFEVGMESIDLLLDRAEVTDSDIEVVLALGGMAEMPAIRSRLLARFGPERVPRVDQADRLIARGAAWIANDERRLHLAKPFELLLADDSPVRLMATDQPLPIRDENQVFKFGFHCVDPRDAFARFQLMRPVATGRPQATDPRIPYDTLFLTVDPSASPLSERLWLELRIDEDLVVSATVGSEQTGASDEREIFDLEFGLEVGLQ